MSRILVRVVSVFLSCASLAFAQEPAPATPPPLPEKPTLTVEECVARALQKNFDLKIEAFSTDIAREALVVAEADFEPVFSASLQRFSDREHWRNGSTRTDVTDARIGVSQFIPTGALVSLSASVDKNSTNRALFAF